MYQRSCTMAFQGRRNCDCNTGGLSRDSYAGRIKCYSSINRCGDRQEDESLISLDCTDHHSLRHYAWHRSLNCYNPVYDPKPF